MPYRAWCGHVTTTRSGRFSKTWAVCNDNGGRRQDGGAAGRRRHPGHQPAHPYLAQPGTGVRGIYAEVVRALGATPCFQRSNLVPQATELLEAEEIERGKTVVVVADEGHLYSPEQLESLRLLGNARMDSHSPFALVIAGQPTLRRRLRLASFAALEQRIGLRYHIDGLDLAETAGYVKHHLSLAGRSDPMFSDDALSLIHQTSRGMPRALNNLAIAALVAAFADGKGIVDESSARAAVAEVTSE